jgi:SAM-dependent methyltransferase
LLTNNNTIVEMTLERRICECCGSNDLESVWSNQSIVRRATSTWLFPVRIVVCRQCGFCFASPCPILEDLARYHADSLSGYKGIGVPYSIDCRVKVLSRYSSPSGILAEIGGDRPEEFHKYCTALFEKILNIEVAEDAPADYRNIEDLPAETVDLLVHYDVLEHIPNVKKFLLACHRALKENGIMVCEVPDVRLYPRNLLLLEFEHVNHFSITTLAVMAQVCGLQLIEANHICSRPYGFAAVFRKIRPVDGPKVALPYEYVDTLACVKGGIEQVERQLSYIKSLQVSMTRLGERGKKITLWGVTDLLRRFLENYRLPDTAIVIDSDPRRRMHLEREGVTVLLPKDNMEHIVQSNLLVIFAPRYKREILCWIEQETGRSFSIDEVVVIGCGPNGETLV